MAGGPDRQMSIQRKIENGVTLADYKQSLEAKGEKIPERIKRGVQEFVDGMREMKRKEGLYIDERSLNPTFANLLVDPINSRVWLIDNNHIFDEISSEELYEQELKSLEEFVNG